MRLIDADALVKQIEKARERKKSYGGYDVLSGIDVLRYVEDAPTVDAVPVKHGRWIDKPNKRWPAYDIRYCSVCGWEIHKSKLRTSDLEWGYCPNCGADMREEEKNGRLDRQASCD